MSFDFGNINPPLKAHATYKDGGGMGGGGMYFQQKNKRKEEPDEDMFERAEDKNENEITLEEVIPEENLPQNSAFNKFVNWFRINKD